jgi:tRNA-Thr(GGU) m(6)t(6)A37 methyltransferase TsaA
MSTFDPRPGEQRLERDPATAPADAHLVFIGRIRSAWTTRAECPKNPGEARERGKPAALEIEPAYRAGLAGLERFSHAVILYWMHQARRDLIVQAPQHVDAPRGVFALRSPVRPNPIAMAVVRLGAIDLDAGRIGIDATDALDGTPLIDIKPYRPGVDAVPDAVVG